MLTVEADNGEDEAQTQDEHNNGVNTQTGALVGVELQHGAGRATCTSGASRGWASITQRFLVVGGGAAAHGSTRTAGGSGRGRTVDG